MLERNYIKEDQKMSEQELLAFLNVVEKIQVDFIRYKAEELA